MHIEIPDSFELLCHTINVVYHTDLMYKNNTVGESRYRENLILLQARNEGHPYPEEQVQHAFYHELIHFMLCYSGAKEAIELNKNEDAVDLIAGLLMQFEKTKTFPNKRYMEDFLNETKEN